MPKVKQPKLPPGALTPAPGLVVADGQLVIEWPPGDKAKALVISTEGYEAMVARLNACHRRIAADAKVVAAARKIVASMPKQDQPTG